MKVVVVSAGHIGKTRRAEHVRTLDADGPYFSALIGRELFDNLIGTVDVREGDELTLEVSLTRRTRPERTT